MSDDGEDIEEEPNPLLELWPDLELLTKMPTSRLTDVMVNLVTKPKLSVLNLDACLPAKEACVPVLKTILFNLTPAITTLSLRFNNLPPEATQCLVEWIAVNKTVHVVYLMNAGMDEKKLAAFEAGFKKNLFSHRTDNSGLTFIRIPALEEEEEEEN